MRVRVRCVRHGAHAFECTHRWLFMLMLLLCNNTLLLLSNFCSFEEGTIVPSASASEPARSIDGTLMATSLQRASPDGAGGPAPRPPAAAPRARIVPPSGAQGKIFFRG
jgi:hypothetical protein